MDSASFFLIILAIWHFVGLFPIFIIQGVYPTEFKTRTRLALYIFLIGPVSAIIFFMPWFIDYLRDADFKPIKKTRDFFLDKRN